MEKTPQGSRRVRVKGRFSRQSVEEVDDTVALPSTSPPEQRPSRLERENAPALEDEIGDDELEEDDEDDEDDDEDDDDDDELEQEEDQRRVEQEQARVREEQARRDQAQRREQMIDTTAKIATYRIQVRLHEPGPPKSDGRRGRILVYGKNAPYEVAQWFRSPDCNRVDPATGKRIYIWVDDQQISDNSAEPVGEEDEREVRDQAPAPIALIAHEGSLQATSILQTQMQAITQQLDRQLQAATQRHNDQLERLRIMAEAEVNRCDEQIANARARVDAELLREVDELDQLDKRREITQQQRQSMAAGILSDSEMYDGVRKVMQSSLTPQAQTSTVESVVKGFEAAEKAGLPLGQVLGTVLSALLAKLGPVPPVTPAG